MWNSRHPDPRRVREWARQRPPGSISERIRRIRRDPARSGDVFQTGAPAWDILTKPAPGSLPEEAFRGPPGSISERIRRIRRNPATCSKPAPSRGTSSQNRPRGRCPEERLRLRPALLLLELPERGGAKPNCNYQFCSPASTLVFAKRGRGDFPVISLSPRSARPLFYIQKLPINRRAVVSQGTYSTRSRRRLSREL